MPDTISALICAYTEERWNDLVAAVESLRQQTLPADEIIVVIDHNPALLKRAQEFFPDVIVVENKEACGASGSRNSGLAVAKGEIIACLDDDAIAIPKWLELLKGGFTHSDVVGVGGAIHPLWMSHYPAWLPREFYWVIGCTFQGMPHKATRVRKLIAANMAMRREVFDSLGGFRSEIGRLGTWPISAEETEFCVRVHQHWPHAVFRYLPEAIVFQRVPEKRTSWRYFCSRCYAEGLSKAMVTRYVGTKDGLASERDYTLRTLPEGIKRGISEVFLHRSFIGLAQSLTIVAGFIITVAGYLVEKFFSQLLISRNRATAKQEYEL